MDFGFLTDDVFFLEKNFEKFSSQKNFRRLPPAKILFSEIAKSWNFRVKIGDFWKFATPPENFFYDSPDRIFYDPPLTRKSLLTYDPYASLHA